MAETPEAPPVVQYWTAATLLVRANQQNLPIESVYNELGQYDQQNFDTSKDLPKDVLQVVQKATCDYLEGRLQVAPTLYCQSRSYFGNLLMGWFCPKTGLYQYYSTGNPLSEEVVNAYIE